MYIRQNNFAQWKTFQPLSYSTHNAIERNRSESICEVYFEHIRQNDTLPGIGEIKKHHFSFYSFFTVPTLHQ